MTDSGVHAVEELSMRQSFAPDSDLAFLQDFCVPFLVGAQNQDGGWGFQRSGESRVEPTCWSLLALRNAPGRVATDTFASGRQYLLAAQLRDGSWPASREETRGSWVTSLACSALSAEEQCTEAVSAGLRWLCRDFPRDSSPFRLFVRRFFSSDSYSAHDDSLRGWGWTPRTSSWVEPTAFALLALRDAASACMPRDASARQQLAVELLYDRMCPGGGWNCGNPMVYGVPGEPLVLSTSWALLALRDYPSHEKKSAGLAWLRNSYPQITSPGSRAVAKIALQAYGAGVADNASSLSMLLDQCNHHQTVHVIAWTCLALNPQRAWFPPCKGAA